MTTKNYYPLPVASGGGGGSLTIENMYPTAIDANKNRIQYATSNPRGTISKQFAAVVQGGTSPYTYAWTLASGTISCNNTAIVNPFFAATGSALGNITTAFGTWELTVTDAASTSVSAYIGFEYYFGQPIP